MKIRNCLARTTPALWSSGFALAVIALLACAAMAFPSDGVQRKTVHRPPAPPLPAAHDLAGLVRAWRTAPSPARRAAVEAWGSAHPKDAAAVHLALGVGDYEQKDFLRAIADLQKAPERLPAIADYANYYLAAARVETSDFASVPRETAAVRSSEVPSPLASRSWLIEARALKGSQAADAIRLLRDHYAALPQPEGDVTLGDCYQAAGDLASAVEFYQRVYYQYTSGDSAARAASALLALKDSMGGAYPQPLPRQMLGRADRYLELHDYPHAR